MRNEPAVTANAEPTSHYARLGGIKLHYLDWGGDSSRLLMLLHGGSAHAHWWDEVAPMLTGFGHVISVDFRGHGRSEWVRPADYGPGAYVEDVVALAGHLRRKPVLIGHSMGGAVAQWVAAAYPELVQALIIVDAPAGPPPLWLRLMWRWRRRARGRIRPELNSPQAIVAKFRLSPPGTYLSSEALARLALSGAEQLAGGRWAFRFDPQTRAWRRGGRNLPRPSLKKIVAPTLILRGAQSTLVSAPRARRMHRKIGNSIYKEIPRAFHHVPLDNPGDTAAAIGDFLSGLDHPQVR